jgi:hypothetical protein
MKTIHIRNLNNQGDKIAYTADVKEDGKVVSSHTSTVRSREELNNTLKNLISVTDQVGEDFATLTEGEWVFPEPVKEVPEVISAEEVAKQEQAQKEQELREAVEKEEWKEKVEKLALTDTNVATKLRAIEGTKDVVGESNLKR